MKRILLISLLIILLTPLLFSMIGCVKPPETKVEYGPEVANAEISAKLKTLPTPDSYGIYKNQSSEFRMVQSIRDVQSPTVLRKIKNTVLAREEFPSDKLINYRVLSEFADFQDGEFQDYARIIDVPLKMKTSTQETETSAEVMQKFENPIQMMKTSFETASQLLTLDTSSGSSSSAPPKIVKITYHNLASNNKEMDPPAHIQSMKNCAGIPNCKIHVNEIVFDRVLWTSDGKGTKSSFSLAVSKDVPYAVMPSGEEIFPGLISQCSQAMVKIQGRQFLLTQCLQLIDFDFPTE